MEKVASEGDLLKVTEEVGLRPSTVLMFDRLIFVEGPSDEAILTELSRKLKINMAATNTAIVQMGGATRFAHYAAEATLNLLSRRRIKMWFVLDRDEKDDKDIEKLLQSLDGNAELFVLDRREIENYLLVPDAVHQLIQEKSQTSGKTDEPPSVDQVADALREAAEGLLDTVVALQVGKRLLRPIYADKEADSFEEKLKGMSDAASQRLVNLEKFISEVRGNNEKDWTKNAMKLAPGSKVLDLAFQKFGLRYRKEIDGVRLAEKISESAIDLELSKFLRKFSA